MHMFSQLASFARLLEFCFGFLSFWLSLLYQPVCVPSSVVHLLRYETPQKQSLERHLCRQGWKRILLNKTFNFNFTSKTSPNSSDCLLTQTQYRSWHFPLLTKENIWRYLNCNKTGSTVLCQLEEVHVPAVISRYILSLSFISLTLGY